MSTFFNNILNENPIYKDSIINVGVPLLQDVLYGNNTYSILYLPNLYNTGAYQQNHNNIYYSNGNQNTALQMILEKINTPSLFVIDLSNDTLDYSIYDAPSVRGYATTNPVIPSTCSDIITSIYQYQNTFIVFIKNYTNILDISNNRISNIQYDGSEACFTFDPVPIPVTEPVPIPVTEAVPTAVEPVTEALTDPTIQV